jgi:hypothetical protein
VNASPECTVFDFGENAISTPRSRRIIAHFVSPQRKIETLRRQLCAFCAAKMRLLPNSCVPKSDTGRFDGPCDTVADGPILLRQFGWNCIWRGATDEFRFAQKCRIIHR